VAGIETQRTVLVAQAAVALVALRAPPVTAVTELQILAVVAAVPVKTLSPMVVAPVALEL
jgi:hypothetical protein